MGNSRQETETGGCGEGSCRFSILTHKLTLLTRYKVPATCPSPKRTKLDSELPKSNVCAAQPASECSLTLPAPAETVGTPAVHVEGDAGECLADRKPVDETDTNNETKIDEKTAENSHLGLDGTRSTGADAVSDKDTGNDAAAMATKSDAGEQAASFSCPKDH